MLINLDIKSLNQKQLKSLAKACVKEYNNCACIADGKLILKHNK